MSSPSNLVGLVPIGAGFLVLAAAWRLFWRAQTNLNPFNPPDRFIQVGPYRFSRNPMYLGMALILTGTWLLLGALSPLALVAGFILLTQHWYIVFEEREMLAKYGPEYAAYQTRTRRWI